MKQVTKVAIADDHEAIRRGIRAALAPLSDFQVVGEAADGTAALLLVKELAPSILILDIALPDVDGVELARRLRRCAPKTRIVVYTMHSGSGFFLSMLQAGVSGYVIKDDPLESLLSALRAARDGEPFFSDRLIPILRAQRSRLGQGRGDDLECLSCRERRVFLRLAEGRSVKEIAFELTLSPKTVETYKYRLMGKLGARNVVELTRRAIKGKLLQP